MTLTVNPEVRQADCPDSDPTHRGGPLADACQAGLLHLPADRWDNQPEPQPQGWTEQMRQQEADCKAANPELTDHRPSAGCHCWCNPPTMDTPDCGHPRGVVQPPPPEVDDDARTAFLTDLHSRPNYRMTTAQALTDHSRLVIDHCLTEGSVWLDLDPEVHPTHMHLVLADWYQGPADFTPLPFDTDRPAAKPACGGGPTGGTNPPPADGGQSVQPASGLDSPPTSEADSADYWTTGSAYLLRTAGPQTACGDDHRLAAYNPGQAARACECGAGIRLTAAGEAVCLSAWRTVGVRQPDGRWKPTGQTPPPRPQGAPPLAVALTRWMASTPFGTDPQRLPRPLLPAGPRGDSR